MIFYGGAITWESRKQMVIAFSMMEVEYVALSEAGRKAVWLQNLCGELGFKQQMVLLMGGNDESLTLATNPKVHQQMKHIELRYCWVREKVHDGVIDSDADQTSI